jgi:hypothetical protein
MDTATLTTTRRSLHTVAEHLLAADLWSRTGLIGLRPTPGGFGQPETFVDGGRRRLRVDGTRLVVLDGEVERWKDLSSLADAAAFAGTGLGAPTEVFTPDTELRADAPLSIDPAAAGVLAAWFSLVETALEELRRRHVEALPTIPQLWPEHFDLAIAMSEINFGGSPGDAAHVEPYLYVGPWAPLEGPDWNEPWGASLPAREVSDTEAAVEFFEAGLHTAIGARTS